jgi:hypothetical protein
MKPEVVGIEPTGNFKFVFEKIGFFKSGFILYEEYKIGTIEIAGPHFDFGHHTEWRVSDHESVLRFYKRFGDEDWFK